MNRNGGYEKETGPSTRKRTLCPVLLNRIQDLRLHILSCTEILKPRHLVKWMLLRPDLLRAAVSQVQVSCRDQETFTVYLREDSSQKVISPGTAAFFPVLTSRICPGVVRLLRCWKQAGLQDLPAAQPRSLPSTRGF